MTKPNLLYLHKLAPNDAGFRKRMLATLVREFPEELQGYQSALAEKDWKQAFYLMHRIKHKISIFSMEDAYELAERHEMNLEKGDPALHGQVMQHLEAIQAFLEELA